MLIIDAQVHIWGKGLPTNPSHRQITSFTADDLLKEMDEGGIDAAVIHPPGWDPNAPQQANEAAEQHPGRLSVLGKVPLDDPTSRELVKDWILFVHGVYRNLISVMRFLLGGTSSPRRIA